MLIGLNKNHNPLPHFRVASDANDIWKIASKKRSYVFISVFFYLVKRKRSSWHVNAYVKLRPTRPGFTVSRYTMENSDEKMIRRLKQEDNNLERTNYQWTIKSATTFLERCRKVVLEILFEKSGLRKMVLQTWIFFWFEKSGWPEKKWKLEEPLFYTFLEKWLQIKWLNGL